MATYVFSDVHGHFKTFDRLLEQVSPAAEDEVWVLGDMVDRGPDSVSVLRTCRELAPDRILMGNHEDMLLDFYVRQPGDTMAAIQWAMNGGLPTEAGLNSLPRKERLDYIDWIDNLKLSAHVTVGDRNYILVHAGLRPLNFTANSRWTDATFDALLRYQNTVVVLWMRDEYWGAPTGFINEHGEGPIVIAGHTPVPYVEDTADVYDRPARNVDGECQVMHLGATPKTGNVADRWAIDCGAAGGAGWGRICMVRLDDGKEFYASVLEGE